jgi:hypothetical protein
VYISSTALLTPTSLGSIHASPYSATKPRFEKITEKRAFSDANRKSQYSGSVDRRNDGLWHCQQPRMLLLKIRPYSAFDCHVE